ncbi:putative siderophore-interacting FAD-binding domain protein [metagenome]|uniref:Putative siderophore-interacting FAD-binding domain protein n=1 Tax=metagenome TaxID=256318 RepID=A0A2P2BWY4_9ZZZZ
MSTRAATYSADVVRREQLASHFVRIVLGGPGLTGFTSTGIPDEWVALTVPGQFQTRYYTVRSWSDGELTLDIVVHDHGLVTEWAAGECLGDTVTVSEPKGSFHLPAEARWLLLVGDLTALPAVGRIIETHPELPVTAWVETPDAPIADYVEADITWSTPPDGVESATAAIVESIDWPDGAGYFWMAGESAQMRAIRKHLMRDIKLPGTAYDVMGYWRGGGQRRQPRAVDPAPFWRQGKATGKSDTEIWAAYDAAREAEQ